MTMTIIDHFVALYQRVQSLERRAAGAQRYGSVVDVDYAKRLMRVRIGGTDAEPYLSPWIPWAETASGAGGVNVAWNPKPGQNVVLSAPGGDLQQAVATPFTWSDEHASPSSSGDEAVLRYGQSKITIKGDQAVTEVGAAKITQTNDGVTIEVGGVSVAITAGGLTVTGGMVKHNAANIGDTHVHGGILPGPANTGVPAN